MITEDDYIDYLNDGRPSRSSPSSYSAKLRYSHFLFLGYTMRDWSLRVFLKRIFGPQRIPNNSWAIQPNPDKLDTRFWQRIQVDLFEVPLQEYVAELGTHAEQAARASRGLAPDREPTTSATAERSVRVRTSGSRTTRRSTQTCSSAATPQIAVIIGNLRAARLTLLYAESGVGKSSLLRAGVAAQPARSRRARRRGPWLAAFVPVVFSSWS